MERGLSTLPRDPFQVLADDIILLCDWKQYRQRNTVADLAFTFSRACVPLLVRIWLPWFFPLWLFKSESKKQKQEKTVQIQRCGNSHLICALRVRAWCHEQRSLGRKM